VLPLGSVSLTSDCCLFQHQITSNFYATVSYKLNASINKPNKARLLLLNPKQYVISPLNGEVVYNFRKMLVSMQRRELFYLETITKHTLGYEIDERNLKIMNPTYFCPKMRGNVTNVENKNNNPVNIKFVDKTSDIYLRTSHLMSSRP